MRAEPPQISIHVLRVEDDGKADDEKVHTKDFNPRPPCGGRRDSHMTNHEIILFQSTSSVWRTTEGVGFQTCTTEDFNPRPPCGGRHRRDYTATVPTAFQSTSSVWRTTSRFFTAERCRAYFNPRPPCGGRHDLRLCQFPGQEISIHVLRVEDDSKNREKSLFAFI